MAPTSAVPVITLPLLALITGVAGATVSTVVLAGPLVLPAGSWATALTTVPLASGVPGVKVQLPLPSARVWPIGLPLPSVRITRTPGSAVPLSSTPLLGSITGVAGATASTVVLTGPLVLPAASWATALITVPLVSGVPGVKLQLPLPSAVACPIGLPPPSVRITVAPASAVPLITVPLLGSSTGVAGATESTVVLAGPLVLPAASWASALITEPLASGVPGVKLQLPLPSAVTCPIGLPLPSVRVTLLPGSAVPLRVVPLLGSTVGVAGATASTVTLAGGLLLPAASLATTLTTVPSGNGVDGVKDQLPLASAVVWPIGLPLPSVRVTLLPGSAVPLSSLPLLGSTTGALGATPSTVMEVAGLLLPAASLATTLTTVPSGSWLPGVKLQLPLASALVWPIGLPLPSVITMVTPASAVPLRTLPLLALTWGASGKSGASAVTGVLLLPAGSVTTTVTVSPLVSGGFSGTSKLPPGPTITVVSGWPSPSVSTPTVEPGSALPVTLLPSGATCTSVAGAGAVVSGAVTWAGGLALPAGSVTTTVTVWPLVSGGFSGAVKLPLASAITVRSGLPSPLVSMPTLAPASAWPLMLLPSGAIFRPLAAFGGVVSGGTEEPPPPPPPLLLEIATPAPMAAAPTSSAVPALMPPSTPAPVSDSKPARLSCGM
ncbi:hypothetical protein PAERUG_P62_London_9_VIM_2_01_14_03960 [Pseudomonas aeruginosa]|nr:hypothetical protein PAERUG_P62_London_9_VIM_2_01_14_03960 [Pseudomonas aeruginosa]